MIYPVSTHTLHSACVQTRACSTDHQLLCSAPGPSETLNLFNVNMTEATGMGIQTIRSFFTKFCAHYARHQFPVSCARPDAEQIQAVLAQYEALGFPGCVGSIDCVHISWQGCPAALRNTMCGAKGKPTLSFEVISTSSRRIISSTRAFYGTRNDKTVRCRQAPLSCLFVACSLIHWTPYPLIICVHCVCCRS